MQTISPLTWGARRRLHALSQFSMERHVFSPGRAPLSSVLCQHRHTGACHLVLEFFKPSHLHDHNSLPPIPAVDYMLPSTSTSLWLGWGRAELRQACLLGLFKARAVLFQGVALHLLTVGQLDTRGPQRRLQTRVGLHLLLSCLYAQRYVWVTHILWPPVKKPNRAVHFYCHNKTICLIQLYYKICDYDKKGVFWSDERVQSLDHLSRTIPTNYNKNDALFQ